MSRCQQIGTQIIFDVCHKQLLLRFRISSKGKVGSGMDGTLGFAQQLAWLKGASLVTLHYNAKLIRGCFDGCKLDPFFSC